MEVFVNGVNISFRSQQLNFPIIQIVRSLIQKLTKSSKELIKAIEIALAQTIRSTSRHLDKSAFKISP